MNIKNLEIKINKVADKEKAISYSRFFKTGKGEYGEGDKFLGLNAGEQRRLARESVNLNFKEIKKLLDNEYHEYRLIGFFILVYKFEKADEDYKKRLIDFYLDNIHRANNWDLIDCICDKILGKWLIDKDKDLLYGFAISDSLWKRRIAIISTFEFIRNNKFDDSLNISRMLLNDNHDLIHKAVGWMLREIGKRDINILEDFLYENYKKMPRTMLRYAIEKFDNEKRNRYLKGRI